MNSKKFKTTTLLVTGATVICMLVTTGCQKKTKPAPATEANAVAAAEVKQTMCPVMEAPINKKIFTEYQGKKVYFCCPQCKGDFEKNPEKYLDKLPQFKK